MCACTQIYRLLPRVAYIIFRVQNKSARPLFNHYEKLKDGRNRASSQLQCPEHTLHTHEAGPASASNYSVMSSLQCVCFFFLWNKEKLITLHPTSFEMSLSSHLDLPNVCREEGNRLTDTQSVMTRWLKGWLGLWPLGVEQLGGDFIFLTDNQPESRGHACQSTAELQGSTRSLSSPLGHVLCKKSP